MSYLGDPKAENSGHVWFCWWKLYRASHRKSQIVRRGSLRVPHIRSNKAKYEFKEWLFQPYYYFMSYIYGILLKPGRGTPGCGGGGNQGEQMNKLS